MSANVDQMNLTRVQPTVEGTSLSRKLLIYSEDSSTQNFLVSVSKKFRDKVEILTIPEDFASNWKSYAIESKSDLIILDLDVEGILGVYDEFFETVNTLRKQRKEIILLSEDINNALLAIECFALHFFLKPIHQNSQKLINAITRGLNRIEERDTLEFYKSKFKELSASPDENSKIELPISNGVTIGVFIKDILRLESFGQFTNVYLKKAYHKKTKYTLNIGLGECEALLPIQFFFRVHKKFIINKLNIKTIMQLANNNLIMHSKYGMEIPIARRKKKAFKSWIN